MSPQSNKESRLPPPISVTAPSVKIEEAITSPPIPFRNYTKRPLSAAEVLGSNNTSFAANKGITAASGPVVKKLRAESPNPANQVELAKPAGALGDIRAGAATPAAASPEKVRSKEDLKKITIFQDVAFDWVTYIKKPKT
jgi:hypothetical protein